MVLGVPLLDLANSMGHASPDTTTGSYLHCFDFLQREQLETYLMRARDETGFAHKTLGARFGIGRTAVLALISRYERARGERVRFFKREDGETESHHVARCDRHLIPVHYAIKLLGFRLGLG